MKRIKVALIGHGHLGKWHAQKVVALSHFAELVAIVEPYEPSQKAVRESYPNIKVVSHLAEIIDLIDAAVVATPTSLHFEISKELLLKNKHVFCEKPVTSTYEESQELLRIAHDKKVVFAVGQSERCHQIFEEKEKFGEFLKGPCSIRIDRVAPFKGRATDVDVVQDLMIHDIDLLLNLIDEKPIQVHSVGFKMRTDKWDNVTSTFLYKSGTKAVVTVSRNHTSEVRKFEVSNKIGTLEFDLFASKWRVARGSATTPETFVEEASYPKRDHLFIEQEAFYKAIHENKRPIATLDEGAMAVYLVDKVLLGLSQNSSINL